MSTTTTDLLASTLLDEEDRPRKIRKFSKPWRERNSSNMFKPKFVTMCVKYLVLVLLFLIAVFPFVWQLSMSFKGATEDIYMFPPKLIPEHPTLEHYSVVSRTIPILSYAWHSCLVAGGTVLSNVVLATLAGYAIGIMKFRGKGIIIGLLFSTMLLPGEVTLTSQYLTVRSLGVADTLWGVFLPGAVGAINVLLMATACRAVPKELIEAAMIDGATVWERIYRIVWPNVRGMASVVALFSFIGAWDDFLWPLVVLSDPSKYTLTVGMQYLNSNLQNNPRVVAAGTVIALIPIIILFAACQRMFFRGVEEGGVKG